MKKIINIILLIFMTFLSSCNKDISKIEMIANYDYGNMTSGKSTMLFNGCEKFFDEKDYDIDVILAGDIIKVSHTGSMQVALSYPGKVNISNGKVKLEGEDKMLFERLITLLEDDDDLQNVYHNVELG